MERVLLQHDFVDVAELSAWFARLLLVPPAGAGRIQWSSPF